MEERTGRTRLKGEQLIKISEDVSYLCCKRSDASRNWKFAVGRKGDF